MFCFVAITCILTIGAFMALLWYSNFGRNIKGGKLITVLIACAIGLGVARLMFWDAENQRKIWNDGICAQCGGQMEFTSASHAKFETYYYFQCRDCGNIIELSRNPY